jgi:hypothetical protein
VSIVSDRWARFAPLLGVLFAVLTIVGFVGSPETPEGNASSAAVIAFYRDHASEVKTFNVIFVLAFVLLVLFAGALRSYLRRTPAAEGPAAIALAGAVLMAAGAIIGSSVEFGLAENLNHLEPATAQALNLLSDEIFLPVLCGAFLFAISSGIAVLRGAALPKWLGWVAIVIAVLALVPTPATLPALFALVIWSVIVSILIFLRLRAPEPDQPEPGVASAG